MDPDSKNNINDLEKKIFKQLSDILPDGGNVLQPTWVRHIIQTSNGMDKFLLDYGCYFLPSCGIISWAIFLIAL
jgi:hypothetical protein